MRACAILIATLGLTVGALAPAAGQTSNAAGQTSNNAKAEAIIHALTPTNPSAGPTRGIRIAKPGQPANAPSVSLNVHFATNSATLTPTAMRDLDSLGRALGDQRLAVYHFRIEGHTDTVGSKPYNKTLSQQRAEAVASYLESKYQIAPTRLTAIGMGEEGLLVATPEQTPDVRNRRVLVVNVGS
jgi:OmpA-OmpF porin, OOP family